MRDVYDCINDFIKSDVVGNGKYSLKLRGEGYGRYE